MSIVPNSGSPAIGRRTSALHGLQDPGELRPGEVGGQGQPGRLAIPVGSVRRPGGQPVADPLGSGVLPDDRRVDRLAGGTVPDDCGLALVGDADGDDIGRFGVGPGQRRPDDLAGVGPDLVRVVLDPAGPGKVLGVLELVRRDRTSIVIDQQAAAAGGALVDRDDIPGHSRHPLRFAISLGARRLSKVDVMRARDLAERFPVVHLDTSALDATRLLVDQSLPGLVVVDREGVPLVILPGSQVLRFALPEYVEEDRSLASVFSEADADKFCEALRGRTVAELMPSKQFMPQKSSARPIVAPDANLMEIAAVMADQHSPVVAVVDDREIVGVITVHRLLGAALPA